MTRRPARSYPASHATHRSGSTRPTHVSGEPRIGTGAADLRNAFLGELDAGCGSWLRRRGSNEKASRPFPVPRTDCRCTIACMSDQEHQKNPAAVALGRLGGRKGGKARAERLTPARRSEIAKMGARARWAKQPDTLDTPTDSHDSDRQSA